jgi:hypothetical protein
LHPLFGLGTLEARQVFGRARVRFDDYPTLPRTVRRAELAPRPDASGTAVAEEPVAPSIAATPPTSSRAPSTDLHPHHAWQTLEALRLGVVPSHGVKQYTISRERELESIDEVLAERRGCRIVWGDYGTGKTHLLDATEQLALESGFATARITLDPRTRALHHPLRLYRAVVESIRTADSTSSGLEEILDRLVDSPDHHRSDGPRASPFFTPYLHTLRLGTDEEIGWLRDYIRGDNIDALQVNQILQGLSWRGPRALRMSDFRTYGRMYIHLVGTLAAWCGDAGRKGLVLLFDEVERVDVLGREDQHYAYEVLKHYAAVTIRPDDLAFDPDQLYKGGHEVHRRIPLRFRVDQPLSAIFALTPLPEAESEFENITTSRDYDVHLQPLHRHDIVALVERIAHIYGLGVPGYSPSASTLKRVAGQIEDVMDDGHDSFRFGVRSAVFLLDQDRLGHLVP